MSGIRRLLLVLAVALLPGVALADLKAIEEAARKEADLTWYTAHYPIELAEEIGRAFEALEKLSPQIGRPANDPMTMLNSGERAVGFCGDVAPLLPRRRR